MAPGARRHAGRGACGAVSPGQRPQHGGPHEPRVRRVFARRQRHPHVCQAPRGARGHRVCRRGRRRACPARVLRRRRRSELSFDIPPMGRAGRLSGPRRRAAPVSDHRVHVSRDRFRVCPRVDVDGDGRTAPHRGRNLSRHRGGHRSGDRLHLHTRRPDHRRLDVGDRRVVALPPPRPRSRPRRTRDGRRPVRGPTPVVAVGRVASAQAHHGDNGCMVSGRDPGARRTALVDGKPLVGAGSAPQHRWHHPGLVGAAAVSALVSLAGGQRRHRRQLGRPAHAVPRSCGAGIDDRARRPRRGAARAR